jgi:hypothetical protein
MNELIREENEWFLAFFSVVASIQIYPLFKYGAKV